MGGVRIYLCAVVIIASTTSMILCSAESVPIVISVPQKSLSIDPTIPTICNAEWVWAASSLIWPEWERNDMSNVSKNKIDKIPHIYKLLLLPDWMSSSSRPLHSSLKRLAPVKLPSPPITHKLVMPCCTRFKAARKRPSRVRKSLQRALPITVPPYTHSTDKENVMLFSEYKLVTEHCAVYTVSLHDFKFHATVLLCHVLCICSMLFVRFFKRNKCI